MADLATSVLEPPPASPAGDIGTELRERLAVELRNGFVSRALELPLGSQEALARVAYLCRLRGATRTEIARAAAGDAGFAATLLRIANSAASASRYPITDLPEAVTRLGTRMVGMLAVTAPALRLLRTENDELVAVRRAIHRHSVRVGVVARELAPPSIYAETALAAGLVHNVGLSVISLFGKAGLCRTMELATPERPFGEIEPEVFGFTHAELGQMLGRAWKYPDALVIAIGEHDREMPPTPLASLVAVADLLVRESGVGIEPPLDVGVRLARRAGLDLDRARMKAQLLLQLDADAAPRSERHVQDDLSAGDLIGAFDDLELAP
jgi:HD-like signal output (HDOD) protein